MSDPNDELNKPAYLRRDYLRRPHLERDYLHNPHLTGEDALKSKGVVRGDVPGGKRPPKLSEPSQG
jgi:hypothetical protein